MNKRSWNILLLTLSVALICLSLIMDWTWDVSSVCRVISLALLGIVAFINFGWCRFVKFIVGFTKVKENCPCFSKEECPYGDKDECIYDTSGCRAFSRDNKRRRRGVLWPLLILSLCVTVFFELAKENPNILNSITDFDITTFYTIAQPILNSFIAAIIVSLLIDIPGRMKEYQTYFVELLSSSDYLKKMTESELTNLRKEVTWLLHVKDYPNMPKKLIDMDEKFCRMLKMPYYKEYSQTVHIQKEDEKTLRKKVSIEYIAFNPQHKDNPVAMDVSFSNSLRFEQEVNIDNAKKLFDVRKLTCAVDNFEQELNLMPLVRMGVSKENRDGFMYNGRVTLMPKDAFSNKDNPLASYAFSTNNAQADSIDYEMIQESGKANMYLSFRDKIKMKLQYEVVVPISDISYTKRLRYPAKYFHLDYTLADDVDFTVVGQLMGTLMDQPDISIDVSENKKCIKMRTHNWLLPKNGAVIVHCKL